MYMQLGLFPVVMYLDSLSDRQVSQAIYFYILFFQLVVQGFSPTATLMHSSDTSYSEADYLSRNTIVVVALPIVSILLSLMRLSFANDQINCFFHMHIKHNSDSFHYFRLSYNLLFSVQVLFLND